jgi:cell division protein FtsW (lipid II flippase)
VGVATEMSKLFRLTLFSVCAYVVSVSMLYALRPDHGAFFAAFGATLLVMVIVGRVA